MTDSIVSSHFGKRPLLNVPALQISSRRFPEVPSHQPAVPFGGDSSLPPVHNTILGQGGYNQSPSLYQSGPWQHNRGAFEGLRNYSAPAGVYNTHGHQYHRYPINEGSLLGQVYPSQSNYPEMANHFSSCDRVPRLPPARLPYASYGFPSIGYNITCHLEYGRIMSIDLRDCVGEFRGVPPFLRSELMRTYGSFPYLKVRVRLEGEEFHIFVSHDQQYRRRLRQKHGRESDTESDIYCDDDDEDEEDYRFSTFSDRKREFESDFRRGRLRNRGARPRGVIMERF